MFIIQKIVSVAKLNPEKVAIHSASQDISYSYLRDFIQKSGNILSKNSNIKIGIITMSKINYMLALLSIYKSGNIPVALPFEFKDELLSKLVKRDGITACIIDESVVSKFTSSIKKMNCVYYLNTNTPLTEIKFEPIFEKNQPMLQLILYTSGTTGMPKGVMLSKKNLISNTKSIVKILKLKSNDCGALVIPPNHAFGNSIINTHFYTGGSIAVANIGFREDVFKSCSVSSIFYGVPSTYNILLENKLGFSKAFKNIKIFASAGGALLGEQTHLIKQYCKKSKILAMYGQTEATARLSYIPFEKLSSSIGTIGIPIPGVKLRIVNSRVNCSEGGEIIAKGNNIMLGYYNDPVSTEKKLIKGWLHTGDIGVFDKKSSAKSIFEKSSGTSLRAALTFSRICQTPRGTA
jgi:long-subunit acyl-CoA synthetase (AMP-forming)